MMIMQQIRFNRSRNSLAHRVGVCLLVMVAQSVAGLSAYFYVVGYDHEKFMQ